MSSRLRRLYAAVKLAVEEREYRPLYHAAAVALIILVACLLFFRNFTDSGTLINVDMTWPSTIARLQFRTVSTWFPFGSAPGTGAIPEFLWVLPTSTVARILRISPSSYMLAMFMSTFAAAGVSMYVLAFRTIDRLKLKGTAFYAPFIGAVLAGLVYMYNPWSIHYFRGYLGYPVYAFLPLLYLALAATIDNPRPRNIVLFALFASVVNTTHMLIWFWGLVVSYLIYYLAANRLRWPAVKKALKGTLGFVAIYALINAIWVMPYLGSRVSGRPLVPFYSPIMSESMLHGLSSNSSMMNNFRLLSIWSWKVDMLKGGTFLQALTFAIPIFAVLGLIVVRREIRGNRTVNFWAAVSVISLLLATGTTFVLERAYRFLVFDAPGSSAFGWMLRSPERWLFFVPAFFALMIGILLARFLVALPTRHGVGRASAGAPLAERGDVEHGYVRAAARDEQEVKLTQLEYSYAMVRFRRATAVAVLVAALVLLSMYPKALDFGTRVYSPTEVPADYAKLQKFIDSQPGSTREAWVPFYTKTNFVYEWAPGKKVSAYSIMSSNDNLNNIYEVMNEESYFNWLQLFFRKKAIPDVQLADSELMLRKDVFSRLMAPFGAQYITFDTSVVGQEYVDSFAEDTSMTKVFETRYLRTYKPDYDPGYIWPATATLNADSYFDNLAIIQKLGQASDSLAFTDGDTFFGATANVPPGYGGVDLSSQLTELNANSGFELVDGNGLPLHWVELGQNPTARVSTDGSTHRDNGNSLRVENASAYEHAWVVGDELPVPPGSICIAKTRVKTKNANWTYARVEGYLAGEDRWTPLVFCPTIRQPDSGWEGFYCSFHVPPGVTKVRPLLGAGYMKDSAGGNAVSWFDDVALFTVNEAVYQELARRPEPPELEVERKSAARYVVKVHGAKAPFVLVQSEAHDGLWSARYADGESVESMPMFSTINGFLIGRTGDFEVVVEYELDKWFRLGVPITIAVIVLCLLFLIYGWWRSRTGGHERKAAPGGTSRGLGRRLAAAVARINEPSKSGLRGR